MRFLISRAHAALRASLQLGDGRIGVVGASIGATPLTEGDQLDELTPREREVLTLVGRGLPPNTEIADKLILSPLTRLSRSS